MTGQDDTESGVRSGLRALFTRLTPAIVKQSYAAKFGLSLSVVILLIALVGAVSFAQVQGISQEAATDGLQSTAQLRAEAVDEWRSNMVTQTRAYSAGDVYASGDADRIDQYLQSIQRATDSGVAVHYVNTTATNAPVEASTRDAIEGKPLSAVDIRLTEPVWSARDAGAADAVVTSETAFETDDGIAMAFASPVRDGEGVVLLVSVVTDELRPFGTDGSYTTTIVDTGGSPVLSTATDATDEYDPGPGFQTALDSGPTTARTGTRVYAYAPVGTTDWIAVTVAEKRTLFRASRTIRQSIVALILTSVVALAAVGAVLGRQTVTPLVRLRRRIETMESGQFDVDLSTDREDEIGQLYTAFGNMRDALRDQIREAHDAREAAEQSRLEMERQNDRLDQFASTLSHDLRNPLAVARGHAELLSAQLSGFDEDDDPEALLDHVEKLADAHDRIDTIIQDVLTLTREGESVDETTPVDLETVASEAWATVDSKDATLSIPETRTFEADRTRLLRAFENLFRNSIDHVGPEVAVEVWLTSGGFTVVDDGPGIPTEAVDNLFEYGHTTSEDGTGIGLSIVKTIAEAHGWRLYVDTTYEDGAMFVFDDVFGEDDPAWYESQFEWVDLSADD